MANSLVQLWDGTNKATVGTSGNLNISMNPISSTPSQSTVSLGTSHMTVLAANTNRKTLMLENDSVNTVYLSFGVSANVSTGMRLNANGGYILMDTYVPQTVVYGIAVGATSNLLVMEG